MHLVGVPLWCLELNAQSTFGYTQPRLSVRKSLQINIKFLAWNLPDLKVDISIMRR
jgi:hypothetical protein